MVDDGRDELSSRQAHRPPSGDGQRAIAQAPEGPAELSPQEAKALAVEDAIDYPPQLQDPTNLRASVVSGVAWHTAVSLSVQATRIVSSLVLVHLLTPADYGLAGMALIVAGFVGLFQDFGLGAALIQRPTITETDRSTAFWTTTALGVVLTLAMIALAGPISAFFHQPELKDMIIVLSLALLIGSLGLTQGSLLNRAMKYRAMSICIIVATVAACATAVIVAAAGGGAWALIAWQLTMTTIVTVALWFLAAWRPKAMFSSKSAKDLGGFGINFLGAGVLGWAQVNVDNVLIGRYLNSFALGLYSVAYNVILIPLGRLFDPVANTLFAAVSRIQNDRARVARVWIRAIRGVSALIMPTILGLFVVAPDFVDVVFGENWHGATPIIRVLGFATLVGCLAPPANSVLAALDRPGLVFRLTAVNSVLAVGAFVVGLQWGVVGVAVSYTVVTLPISFTRVACANRMVGVSTWTFLRSIAGIVEATLAMAVACWIVREGLIQAGVSATLRLVLVVLLGVVVYSLVILWRDRMLVGELKSVLPRRDSSNRRPAEESSVRQSGLRSRS